MQDVSHFFYFLFIKTGRWFDRVWVDTLGYLERCYERETALKSFLLGFSFLLFSKQNSRLSESFPFRAIGINKALRGIKIERNLIKEVKATSHTNKDFIHQRVVLWKEWRLSNKHLHFSELPLRISNFQLQLDSLEAPLEAFTQSIKLRFYTFFPVSTPFFLSAKQVLNAFQDLLISSLRISVLIYTTTES